MRNLFLMVAFTLTATAVFAHQDETKKGGAEQKVQKEQEAQKEQEVNSEDFFCEIRNEEGVVIARCVFCDCVELAKTLLGVIKGGSENSIQKDTE